MRHIPDRAARALAPVAIATLAVAVACGPSMRTDDAQPAPADGVVLSEPQVGGIVMTANTGEVQLSQLALERSQNTEVREFAQRMINDHTASNQQFEMLAQNQGWQPQASQTTQQLERTVGETAQALQTMEGEQFDRAYMRHQVELHSWFLQTLDQTLIPSARDSQLDQLLRDTRQVVAEHLQDAQRVQAML